MYAAGRSPPLSIFLPIWAARNAVTKTVTSRTRIVPKSTLTCVRVETTTRSPGFSSLSIATAPSWHPDVLHVASAERDAGPVVVQEQTAVGVHADGSTLEHVAAGHEHANAAAAGAAAGGVPPRQSVARLAMVRDPRVVAPRERLEHRDQQPIPVGVDHAREHQRRRGLDRQLRPARADVDADAQDGCRSGRGVQPFDQDAAELQAVVLHVVG